MHDKYRNQKHMAAQRGIEFKFTYQEWTDWWLAQLGPNWTKLRGRRKDQYVMARIGDKGGYEAPNVKCVLASVNHKERKPNRTNVKLTEEQARAILYSPLAPKEVAIKYGATIENVRSIKRRLSWRHL